MNMLLREILDTVLRPFLPRPAVTPPWEVRIARAHRHGFTVEDRFHIMRLSECVVGEALDEAGAPMRWHLHDPVLHAASTTAPALVFQNRAPEVATLQREVRTRVRVLQAEA